MAIYTKTGDKGETSLAGDSPQNPKRISKSSNRITAIGDVDELNSHIGLCISQISEKNIKEVLEKIQRDLFVIGSILAEANLILDVKSVKTLEKEIDKMEASLPVLKNFILPGGNLEASQVFIARAVARRAERSVNKLAEKENVDNEVLKFLNRLSDYLFVAARFINFTQNKKETLWRAG